MFLLFAIIVAIFGYYMAYGDISNIPISQLTLKMLGSNLIAGACYFSSLWLLFKSLESDKIWPWKWNKRYLAHLLVKIALILFFMGSGYYILSQNYNAVGNVIGYVGLFMWVFLAPISEGEMIGAKPSQNTEEYSS